MRPLTAVWSPAYEVDIGPHVFPTTKYRRVRNRLLAEEVLSGSDLVAPEPATKEELRRVHTRSYLEKIEDGHFSRREQLLLEVPFSGALREAMVLCCGGTTLALRHALEEGVAAHIGGGFHHAFADHGEGFCLLNDVAVGVAAILAEESVERAAVVDLDVHHGNGTAAIFADDERVFTFSMHQERNYPHPKPPGDLDVGLADGVEDDAYRARLEEHLPRILENHRPDAVVYLAGADPYREDQLGGLSLTRRGLRERDRYVFTTCREAGVPVALLLAGGYALREEDTVSIHCASVEEALRAARS